MLINARIISPNLKIYVTTVFLCNIRLMASISFYRDLKKTYFLLHCLYRYITHIGCV